MDKSNWLRSWLATLESEWRVSVSSGCYNEEPQTECLIKEQKLTSHSSGGWETKIKVVVRSGSGEDLFQVTDGQLLAASSYGRKGGEGAPWGPLFIRALIPIIKAVPPMI